MGDNMGKDNVLKLLEEKGDWISTKEIQDELSEDMEATTALKYLERLRDGARKEVVSRPTMRGTRKIKEWKVNHKQVG